MKDLDLTSSINLLELTESVCQVDQLVFWRAQRSLLSQVGS